MPGVCVPRQTENLLTLSPLYRDYWGEQMAAFTRRLDGFAKAGCYQPRFYHTPDSESQFVGIAPGGYKTYLLSLPLGSFILGWLHNNSSAPGSSGPATTSVINAPPNLSGFTAQITDLSIDHKLFSRPAEEAWFINDNLLGPSTFLPFIDTVYGFTFPSFPRLLPVPYAVVPPGQVQVEFRNSLDTVNQDVQLTFLVMVPDGSGGNATKGSGK
jgi:hypothetical protein